MLFKKKKVYVDAAEVSLILRRFIKGISSKMVVNIEITNDGEVILSTNKPGLLIGPAGRDFYNLERDIKKCGAIKVSIKEMKCVVSNCGIY